MSRKAEDSREQGKPLTLTKARLAVMQALFGNLLFPIFGCIILFVRGDKIMAVLLFLIVPSQWVLLSQSIKNYRLLRRGMAVYLPHRISPLVPKLLSVPVVFVFSVVALVTDAMAVFVAGVRFHTLEAWAVAAAVVLPLTLYPAYCWYRIVGEQRRARAVAFQEGEGVWPPAPKMQ